MKKFLSIILAVTMLLPVGMMPFGTVSASSNDATYSNVARTVAEEGMVLLENNNNSLPVSGSVALFGGAGATRTAKNCTGAGDTLGTAVSIYTGLKNAGFTVTTEAWLNSYASRYDTAYNKWVAAHGAGHTNWAHFFMDDPVLTQSDINTAKNGTNTAIYVIRRVSGEGMDRAVNFSASRYSYEYDSGLLSGNGQGEYELSPNEIANLTLIGQNFSNVIVVLNTCGPINTSFFKNISGLDSLLYAGLGGTEVGNAAAKLIKGEVNPSGSLAYTWANNYADYPSSGDFANGSSNQYVEDIYVGYRYFETFASAKNKVAYPFGYGLSYTTFALSETTITASDKISITASVKVTNTGTRAGKKSVQFYVEAPNGLLGKAKRSLVGYAKTKILAPGASETVRVNISVKDLSSYDDLGKTGFKSCYVLEAGDYAIYAGLSVRDTKLCGAYKVDSIRVTEVCTQYLTPLSLNKRMISDGSGEIKYETVSNSKDYSLEGMPKETEFTKPATTLYYADVVRNTALAEQFVAQLSLDELCALVEARSGNNVDHYTNVGFGGYYGISIANVGSGLIGSLSTYKVYGSSTADGMCGFKTGSGATVGYPAANIMACTFNRELIRQVGSMLGEEFREHVADTILSPGVNILRDPLCGRNPEYFSEDPFLSGTLGAEYVIGVQSQLTGTAVKHFAANNHEGNRSTHDSVASERALREIYLKSFEYVVRGSNPTGVMMSYNLINGVEASERVDLIEGILRGEWGFSGLVMSDWGDNSAPHKNIRAGCNVKMPSGNGDDIKIAISNRVITENRLRQNVVWLIKGLTRLRGYARNVGHSTPHVTTISGTAETTLWGVNTAGATGAVGTEACQDTKTCGVNLTDTNHGKKLTYKIYVENSGRYLLNARVACAATDSSNELVYAIDGVEANTSPSITATGGWQTWATLGAVEVELTRGYHDFIVTANGTNYNINYFTFTPKTVSKNIVEVIAPSVSVKYGTAFKDIKLPDTVTCVLEDGTTMNAIVQWKEEGYSTDSIGTAGVYGTLVYTKEYSNPDNIPAAAQVVVTSGAVTNVKVSGSQTAKYGQKVTFTANVSGEEDCVKKVVWSVNSNYSTINENGVLSVNVAEPAKTLTITATSVTNSNVSDSITISLSRDTYTVSATEPTKFSIAGHHSASYAYTLEKSQDTDNGYIMRDMVSNRYVTFETNAQGEGKYSLALRMAIPSALDSSASIKIYEDGVLVATIKPTLVTGGWNTWGDVAPVDINLSAGKHTIKVEGTGVGYNINYFTLTPVDVTIPEPVLYGDVNNDDSVTAVDALLALQHSVGKTALKDRAFTAADVTAEYGAVTSSDALCILQYAVEIINVFDIEKTT